MSLRRLSVKFLCLSVSILVGGLNSASVIRSPCSSMQLVEVSASDFAEWLCEFRRVVGNAILLVENQQLGHAVECLATCHPKLLTLKTLFRVF